MDIKKSRYCNRHGLTLFALALSGVMSHKAQALDSTFSRPIPPGRITLSVTERPTPIILSMDAIPIQGAMANTSFVLPLKKYIHMSQPQISYQLTNYYSHIPKARYPYGLVDTPSGLPSGVRQIYTRASDCYASSRLNTGESCTLHFLVDPEHYVASGSGYGPVVSTTIYYYWGSHNYFDSYTDTTRVLSAINFDALLAAIALPVHVLVSPEEQDGLRFDKTTQSIVGTPSRTGVYSFKVAATNGRATAAPSELLIQVRVNPQDKPVFKKGHTIASAMPGHEYRLHLMDLLEARAGFNETNQVRFSIDPHYEHPEWLELDTDNKNLLMGVAPPEEAGKIKKITVIASSNTGGDSEPMTLEIPVAFDPAQKPIIAKDSALYGEAGVFFRHDFRSSITDPGKDGSLKIIIDTIEPENTWLTRSDSSDTEITGFIPYQAVGQIYQITLHANTRSGGDSDAVIIPLKIGIDKNKTPRFYAANPQLPLLYEGQSYVHDFVASDDVYPQYSSIPYTVALAEDYDNPAWVRIEDNKLIIDRVPDDIDSIQHLFITIKNIPGGQSAVFPLDLTVMN